MWTLLFRRTWLQSRIRAVASIFVQVVHSLPAIKRATCYWCFTTRQILSMAADAIMTSCLTCRDKIMGFSQQKWQFFSPLNYVLTGSPTNPFFKFYSFLARCPRLYPSCQATGPLQRIESRAVWVFILQSGSGAKPHICFSAEKRLTRAVGLGFF